LVAAPTPDGFTEPQVVLEVTVDQLEARHAVRPCTPAQPLAPVQVLSTADGFSNLVMAAFAGTQPVTDQPNPCALAQTMSSSVDPSAARVRDQIDFTHTVTNPGTVALTDVQVESALPDGLSFVNASGGGAIDPDTGFVAWASVDGLAAGASTSLSISATVTDPGQ